MGGKRKILKKKLKEPDEFITFTQKSILFLKDHFKKITAVSIIVLLIIVSIFIYFKWEGKKELEAQKVFNQAIDIYRVAGSQRSGESLEKEYKKALEKLNEVISRFPKTSSGKIALIYKGNIHLKLGEFEEAIKSYNEFLKKGINEKIYRVFALEGLGYAYEGKKDYKNAIEAFGKITEIGEEFEIANAYLHLGRCEEKLGKNREALENYKKYLSLSPKSFQTEIIIKKVSNLEK